MRLRGRGKLVLIASLAAELACSREREGVLRERLQWFEAALADTSLPTLRLVPDQAVRRSDARIS
jgi:hypothetical protein